MVGKDVPCSAIYKAKTWTQPKCPLTQEWMKKKWHIHKTEYYSAINKNEILWMELEDIMPSGISQTEKRNAILKKKVKTDS